MDSDLKKAWLVTTLKDRALSWYIKYSTTHPTASLKETKDALNNEFKNPNSQAQCVTEVKEIKQKVNESAWDFDQWLKCLLQQASLQISNDKHKDQYIASLLPHLRLPLSQQKLDHKMKHWKFP